MRNYSTGSPVNSVGYSHGLRLLHLPPEDQGNAKLIK